MEIKRARKMKSALDLQLKCHDCPNLVGLFLPDFLKFFRQNFQRLPYIFTRQFGF